VEAVDGIRVPHLGFGITGGLAWKPALWAPCLAIILAARRRNCWLPGGMHLERTPEGDLIISEAAAQICCFALLHRFKFSLTVLPSGVLFRFLKPDVRAEEVKVILPVFDYRTPSLDDLLSYDRIILPAVCHLSIPVSGLALSNRQLTEAIVRSPLSERFWPPLEDGLLWDCKEEFMRIITAWPEHVDHFLPTKVIPFDEHAIEQSIAAGCASLAKEASSRGLQCVPGKFFGKRARCSAVQGCAVF
jgi:hypothetical protein